MPLFLTVIGSTAHAVLTTIILVLFIIYKQGFAKFI